MKEEEVLNPEERLTEGLMVHFVMPDRQCRPAVVVRVWRTGTNVPPPNGNSNLAVFLDGGNDAVGFNHNEDKMVRWRTSITFAPVLTSEGWREALKPGTWHHVGDHV